LAHGIPHLTGEQGEIVRSAYAELIGLCAFIFKRQTTLTQEWYKQVNDLLDGKLKELEQHPGAFAQDQNGLLLADGTPSKYPLRWAELLGEILHPLFYSNQSHLLQDNLEPVFYGYR
jgi:hypothetical protein